MEFLLELLELLEKRLLATYIVNYNILYIFYIIHIFISTLIWIKLSIILVHLFDKILFCIYFTYSEISKIDIKFVYLICI